jgi:hypothetical protein
MPGELGVVKDEMWAPFVLSEAKQASVSGMEEVATGGPTEVVRNMLYYTKLESQAAWDVA